MQISLKAARVNANLTQKEAAKTIGVDVTTMVKWENGRTAPRLHQFKALCSLYGFDMDCISLLSKSI